jgi:hypothetical protein
MTKEDLLKKLALQPTQLADLLARFGEFKKSLDADQLRVLNRSLPTLCEALAWLGPHATVDELRDLFGGGRGHDRDSPPVIVCHFVSTDRT